MDLAAVAETTVEMWVLVDAKLIARKQENIDPSIKAQILSESMKLYMTHIINDAKKTSTTPGEAAKIEPPSPAQLEYAEDLGIANARSMSKQDLSKAIDKALHP